MRAAIFIVGTLCVLSAPVVTEAISLFQVDDFHDATTQSWAGRFLAK